MIDLNEVGAFASVPTADGVKVRFGIYLPGIEQEAGYKVNVRIIHKDDRFAPHIATRDFPLAPVASSQYNLWQAQVTIPVIADTHFGQPGTYLYRYQLLQTPSGTTTTNIVTLWFTDPFAQTTDIGQLSAFTTPGFIPDFAWTDQAWKVPEITNLVVYEMHVEQFNSTFDGVIERLTYLKSLGVTCLELLPVTSLKLDFDWGYGPLHYFAPNER
jgi:maltooligosyltrehalose trehalohydrolase